MGKTQGNENILELERRSTRSHPVENSICKRLWNCCNTGYVMLMTLSSCRYTWHTLLLRV